ncbi:MULTISPECIES: hypothetical protein [unclassified Pseudofrankia]|uniref:hypothetical protein n=1 Tax=unclassified Pseudofrankia TaxID=2994372 RepID=UPI000AF5CD34|nr:MULTISPECIES: hypothetical protein [unclassified Pseudofrankia]MDT3440932.1 hypothetical protein [Pseudofrankia sp. BMG5.37]
MELNEAAVSAGAWAPPGQRDAGAEQVPAETAPAESDVIAVGPVANPKRLRLGVPASA